MTIFFKKPLVRWGLLLLVIFSVYHGVMSNLKSHSLYYLSQSHYDKTKLPEYTLLAENYEHMSFDGLEGEISRTYDFLNKSQDDVIYEMDNGTYFRIDFHDALYSSGRALYVNHLGNYTKYIIEKDGRVIIDDYWDDIMGEVLQSDISTLRQLIAPIMATQKAPAINLQWLFNLFNYGRFD